MDGETAFKIYFPLRLHYTASNYDILKTRGAFKGALSKPLAKRSDKLLFEAIGRKFYSRQDLARFFIANFAYGNMYPVSDISSAMERYNKWKKYKQGMNYYFECDLDFLESVEVNPLEGKLPFIFFKAMTGEIHRETILILNYYSPIIETWESFDIYQNELKLLSKSVGLLIKPSGDKIKHTAENFLNKHYAQ